MTSVRVKRKTGVIAEHMDEDMHNRHMLRIQGSTSPGSAAVRQPHQPHACLCQVSLSRPNMFINVQVVSPAHHGSELAR